MRSYRFLDWIADVGLEPYPAQEEALLELDGRQARRARHADRLGQVAGRARRCTSRRCARAGARSTPRRSRRSSREKFFALCDDFGAENVGMLTGDASINRDAPIICCTAEVLANMALRQGDARRRALRRDGRVPLLRRPRARRRPGRCRCSRCRARTFLLMSATLGDTARDRGAARSAAPAARSRTVHSRRSGRCRSTSSTARRRSTRRSRSCSSSGRAPVYVVNFTQRECAELAQALTSAQLADARGARARSPRRSATSASTRPTARRCSASSRHGIGLHHAGLLPKYRLLVEQLAQQGLLQA